MTSKSSPNYQPSQPAPFGCRIVGLAALFAFVFGVTGAYVGSHVNRPQAATNGSQSASQNTVSVAEETAIIDATNKISPAVVSITSTSESRTFLGPIQEKAGGTGFIITADGLIATNKHVVEGAKGAITVVTKEGKTYSGTIKAIDPTLDFALLKVDAKNLPVVDLGNSDGLQVGQEVIAIGNALGEFQNTVTTGVISAKERTIQASSESGGQTEQLENLLQTDAAINPGNSGGPLINLSGQVIAVNTAVAGDAQGIGFAIPINQAKQAIDSYNSTGKIVRPSLGVRFVAVTKDVASLQKLSVDHGALITGSQTAPGIVPRSTAEKAGLKDGDIITAINGTSIDGDNSLPEIVGKFTPGEEVELTYVRDGKETKVRLKLDERNAS